MKTKKNDEIASIHKDEDNYDITENRDKGKSIKKRHMNMNTHQTGKMA